MTGLVTSLISILAASNNKYKIVSDGYNINENGTVTFTVYTSSDVPDGTDLYWTTIGSNLTAYDFVDRVLSGTVTINGQQGTIVRQLYNDNLTEGVEYFSLQVRIDSTSGPVVSTSPRVQVNDTSLSVPTTITPSATVVNEGDTITFTVSAPSFGTGTLYWTYATGSSVWQYDFNGAPTSGTISMVNGSGTFTLTPSNDVSTLEGNEILIVAVRTSDIDGTIQATSPSILINDTSKSTISQALLWYSARMGNPNANTTTLTNFGTGGTQYNALKIVNTTGCQYAAGAYGGSYIGGGNNIQTTIDFSYTVPGTIFWVMAIGGSSTGITFGNSGGTAWIGCNNINGTSIGITNNSGTTTSKTGLTPNTTELKVYGVVRDGSTTVLYPNTTTSVSLTNGPTGTTTFNAIGLRSTGSQRDTGYWTDILYWDRALTPTEAAEIVTWLKYYRGTVQ
jgi:hypothetical protein